MEGNKFFTQYKNAWKIFFDFVALTLSILIVFFLIPGLLFFYFYGVMVWIIVKIYRPDLDSFIVGTKAALVSESPGNILSNIVMGLVIKGDLSSEKLRTLFQERVLNYRGEKSGKFIYKRLLQSWTYFMGYAFWKNDQENFNLENHIRDYDYVGEISLPHFGDETDFQRILPKLAETPYKEGRSPWEFLIARNFRKLDKKTPTEAHTLLIFRVDHIHCDFYSIMGLFRVLFKSPFDLPKPVRNHKRLGLWNFTKSILMLPKAVNMYLAGTIRGRKLPERSTTENNTYCSITRNTPVETIKFLKKKFHVEFASVIHSATQGAIARVIRESGQIPPSNLDLAYVLPLPDHPGGLNVHAVFIATELPCGTITAKEITETNRILKTHENSPLPVSLMYFNEILSRIPTKIFQASTHFALKFTPSFTLSNPPVTLSKDYVEGMEIVDVFTAVTSSKSIGMVITSWGVNNNQRFNFFLDKSIFGDEVAGINIATYFEEELEKFRTMV